MRDQYYRSGQCYVVVFAITSRRSFDMVDELFEAVYRVKDVDWVPAVLVGNKCDLEDKREVTSSEAEEKAEKYKVPYFESRYGQMKRNCDDNANGLANHWFGSAKTRINVEEFFFECVRQTPRSGVSYKVVVVGDGGA